MPKAIIRQIPIGPMMNYAYLIIDNGKKLCAVVDPSWDADALIGEAKNAGVKIDKILLTHTHFDHANALKQLFDKTNACVYLHEAEAREVPKEIKKKETSDGDTIKLGNLNIKCLHTPGHTPGSQCYLVEKNLITGDTLFVEGCGRVDLPGGSPNDMLDSLRMLASLDDDIVVYPGHNYGSSETTTIGEQKKKNPYMNADSEGMLL